MNEKRNRIIVVGAGLGVAGDQVARALASALNHEKDIAVHLLGIDNGAIYRNERVAGMSHLFMHPYGEPVPTEPERPLTYDPHRLADMSKAKPLPFYHGRRRY